MLTLRFTDQSLVNFINASQINRIIGVYVAINRPSTTKLYSISQNKQKTRAKSPFQNTTALRYLMQSVLLIV